MSRLLSPCRLFALSASIALLASCGSDDGAAAPTTAAAATTTAAPATTSAAGPTGQVDDACALVPTADVAAALGTAVDEGVPGGDERRRVCTFQGTEAAIGVTVGVEAGARFDEKADASRSSLDVDGVEVEGLGDRALFFFSDGDIPEGVGGTLVGVGDLTIDVTLQGLDEAAMRDASVGIATVAVANL